MEPTKRKGTAKNANNKAKFRKVQAARTDSGISEDEALELDDFSEGDLDFDDCNNECVGCGENFYSTRQKVDWIECMRCTRWFHETCSTFKDERQPRGKAILS